MEKYIDKIILNKINISNSYLLNIKYKKNVSEYNLNMKKKIYILVIDNFCMHNNYMKLLNSLIYNNINLNIDYVFTIQKINKEYKLVRLTYDNIFSTMDVPNKFTDIQLLFKFLISNSQKKSFFDNISIDLDNANLNQYINFNEIEKINIFMVLDTSKIIYDSIEKFMSKKIELKNSNLIINGILMNYSYFKEIDDFIKNLNSIGTFIVFDHKKECSNSILKETIKMFLLNNLEKKDYVVKKNKINLKDNFLFFDENSINDKKYFLIKHNDYYIINCKNDNLIENNYEIEINDQKFNVNLEKNIKENKNNLIIECILKEIFSFNIENKCTIYEYYNVFLKIINYYKYINIKLSKRKKYLQYHISSCKLLYQIIEKAIEICNKKRKEENSIINILKIIKKKSTNYIHLKNKNFCIYINRIFKNILNIYENDSKNNNLCDSILNNIDDNKKFEKSCDFFTSLISFTNWYEDIETNNCTCLILNICSSRFNKLGFGASTNIMNITSTFYPCNDYIELCNEFFNNKNDLAQGLMFKGNAIGNGNCVIPLYINKNHWIIAKKKMKYLLGIIMSNNPGGFVKYHYRFVYKLLLDYCNTITMNNMDEKNHEPLTNKYLSCFWSYFRTVAQISFDNNYNRGIRRIVKEYLQNSKKRVLKNEYDYLTMFGQIISTGYIIDDKDIKKIIGYIINEIIKNKLKNDDNNYLLECITEDKNVFNYVDKLVNIQIKNIGNHVPYLFSFYIFNKILKKFYLKFKNYSNFIKTLDNNYGLIPEEYNKEFKKLLFEELNLYEKYITLKSIYEIIYRTKHEHNNIYKLILLDNILKNMNLKMKNYYDFPLDNISSILIFNVLEQYNKIDNNNNKNEEENKKVVDGLASAGGRL